MVPMKHYTITLSEEQLRMLSEACEFTSRFICGQVETDNWPFQALHHKDMDHNKDFDDWIRRQNEMDDLMRKVKMIGWNKGYSSDNGVGFNKNADFLFEAYQVFRHELWKALPDERRVNYVQSAYPPTLNYSGLPFVKCEPKTEPQ